MDDPRDAVLIPDMPDCEGIEEEAIEVCKRAKIIMSIFPSREEINEAEDLQLLKKWVNRFYGATVDHEKEHAEIDYCANAETLFAILVSWTQEYILVDHCEADDEYPWMVKIVAGLDDIREGHGDSLVAALAKLLLFTTRRFYENEIVEHAN